MKHSNILGNFTYKYNSDDDSETLTFEIMKTMNPDDLVKMREDLNKIFKEEFLKKAVIKFKGMSW